MKLSNHITALLFLTLAITTHADAPFTVEEIRQVPTINKAQIYARAQQWIAENFRSSKQVIDLKDADAGFIVGNGAVDIHGGVAIFKTTTTYTFKIRLDIKDEKFRATFTNIMMLTDAGEKPIEDTNTGLNYPLARNKFSELMDSLAKYLTTKQANW